MSGARLRGAVCLRSRRLHYAWRHLVSSVRDGEAGAVDAQRDLFEQILLDTALKGGRLANAQQMLERRRMRIRTACR